jgi:CBS domain-containing protein
MAPHVFWLQGRGAEVLVFLRSTVMDPFLAAEPPVPDHVAGPGVPRGPGFIHPPFTLTSESQAYGRASLYLEAIVKVADLIQRKVKTIHSDATVAEAIVSLADAHISGMPVVDGTGRVIGIVSSTDVLTAEAEAEDRDARQALLDATTVRDVMTPRPYTIAPEEDIREAACQMLYGEVHRLFVAEGDQVVGIITTTDIVRAVATGKL